jgi:hypothetical protein
MIAGYGCGSNMCLKESPGVTEAEKLEDDKSDVDQSDCEKEEDEVDKSEVVVNEEVNEEVNEVNEGVNNEVNEEVHDEVNEVTAGHAIEAPKKKSGRKRNCASSWGEVIENLPSEDDDDDSSFADDDSDGSCEEEFADRNNYPDEDSDTDEDELQAQQQEFLHRFNQVKKDGRIELHPLSRERVLSSSVKQPVKKSSRFSSAHKPSASVGTKKTAKKSRHDSSSISFLLMMVVQSI